MVRPAALLLFSILALSACRGEISSPAGAGPRLSASETADGGMSPEVLDLDAAQHALADAQAPSPDAAAMPDAEAPEVGIAADDAMTSLEDAATADGGAPEDGGEPADAGGQVDSGEQADAGGQADGAPEEGGTSDGGGGQADGGAQPDSGVARPDAGGLNYNPCPTVGPCRYMPLGDSITEGYEGGYRIPLFRSALADQLSITFVGGRANGPATVDGVPFPREHEGHGGFYIDRSHSNDNIADLVVAALAAHSPHIIALMIGANDVARAHMPDSSVRLALLLDQIITAAPDALIVLAQITPSRTDADNVFVEAYNRDIPALVTARQALGKHIILVDMYSAFTAHADYKTSLMYDNLHPGPAGDEVMASVWYGAIRGYLPR